LTASYLMDVAPGKATRPFQVDFYVQASGSNTLMRTGSDSYDLASGTLRSAELDLPAGVGTGTLFAMAIDDDGNSSELGTGMMFSTTPESAALFADGFED